MSGYNCETETFGTRVWMTEKEIKIRLIEYLIRKEKHAVIVPEVSMGNEVKMNLNGSRRADVFAVNGDISIYEIKSERDSLERLDDQIAMYRKFANRVSVVMADKFIGRALDLDENIGVFSYSKRSVKCLRASKRLEIPTESYLQYWWGIELKQFFKGCKGHDLYLSAALEKMRSILSDDEIANVTMFRLKERYKEESDVIRKAIKEKRYDDLFPKRVFSKKIHVTPLRDIPYGIVTGKCNA